jgi:plastocyanin
MRKLMTVLTVLAALSLLAAACGDDDDDDVASTGSESESGSGSEAEGSGEAPVQLEGEVNDHGTEEAGDTLELELDDFYFGPTFVQAQTGATVTVTLNNEGDAPHTFTIDDLDIDEEVAPGDSTDVEVTLPDEGATMFYCRFHVSQGMQGAFFFNAGDEVSSATQGGGLYGG